MIKRIASVDIGTNTVLMLVADIENNNLIKITEKFDVARLGEDVDKTGIIKQSAIERTKNILVQNNEICKSLNVEKVLAVGTSALRDAHNSKDVLMELSNALGSEIRVIEGSEEAALSFLGTVLDDELSMVIDIGGGSTEIIIGCGDRIIEKISLQVGAVRLTERFFKHIHPPHSEDIDNATEYISKLLSNSNILSDYKKVYAVAGTATTLATTALGLADNEVDAANGYILSDDKLNLIYELYKSTSISDIETKLKVHPRRADLILSGALILKLIVGHFNIKQLIVSSHGLRYGILYDFIKNPYKW